VNLNVSATDNAGKAIPGLKQSDFSVYEDGVPQRISFFSPEQTPFNLVLLIDLSGSMKDEIELIKETAIHFLRVIGPQDNVAVITFATDVTVVSHLTRDREDLRENIEYMLPPSGGTAFYDALGYVLVEELRKVKGQRNAVITITGGEDNAILSQLLGPLNFGVRGYVMGSFLGFGELLDGAQESDALIYPIHLDPALPEPDAGYNNSNSPLVRVQPKLTEIAIKQLRALADASGGRFYHANHFEDLKGVFEQVAAELRTVYSMAYTPKDTNFDGRFRRIRVQAAPPGVVIRTRSGYYAR
jgi:VWFA-related protein